MKRRYTMSVLLAVAGCGVWAFWLMRHEGRWSASGAVVGPEATKVVTQHSSGGRGWNTDLGENAAVSGTPEFSTGEETLAHERDAKVDLPDRCQAVEGWVEEGGEAWVARVIEAAKEDPALKATAVRALGRAKVAAAVEYVGAALGDEDAATLIAAVEAWAMLKGEEAVPEIERIVEKTRDRKDGEEGNIRTACARALGTTGSAVALPCLEREIEWVTKQEKPLGYGEDLIEAVGDIGDSRSVETLEWYADELQGRLSGQPMDRRLQMLQIAQARIKAQAMR